MFVKGVLFTCIIILLEFTNRCCRATRVQKCSTTGVEPGDENSRIDNQVFISGCADPPCKIPKNSTVTVEIHFQSDYEISRISNSVYAWVLTIPFPHYGVDGTTACNNLYTASMTKTSCPVQRNKKYIYKSTVYINPTYPKVKITLHWALVDVRNNAPIFCFEVPVKIIT